MDVDSAKNEAVSIESSYLALYKSKSIYAGTHKITYSSKYFVVWFGFLCIFICNLQSGTRVARVFLFSRFTSDLRQSDHHSLDIDNDLLCSVPHIISITNYQYIADVGSILDIVSGQSYRHQMNHSNGSTLRRNSQLFASWRALFTTPTRRY